jgi:hypothetical protein
LIRLPTFKGLLRVEQANVSQPVLVPEAVYWHPSVPKTWDEPGAGSVMVAPTIVPDEVIDPGNNSIAAPTLEPNVRSIAPVVRLIEPARV